MKRGSYLFLLLFLLRPISVIADEDWKQITPSPDPGNRGTPGFCYIGDDKIVLFGGSDGTRRNDTWIFDMSDRTWTELTPATSPSTRNNIYMAYIGDDKACLFGGYTTGLVNDTWVFDLSDNNWVQQSPTLNPAGRYNAGIAYLGDDKVLLYGGTNQSGSPLAGTFVYDLSDGNWTSMSPTFEPSNRAYPGLSYIGDDKVLLYGGFATGNELDGTWIYDFSVNDWSYMNNNTPGALSGPHIAYIGNGQAVLYGGSNNGSKDDTWIYDRTSNVWSLDPNTTKPPATSQGYIATSSLNATSRVMFMYSGQWWLFGNGDVVLPVELSSFTANISVDGVFCKWATESEIENLGFLLERKSDGSDWQEIVSYKTDISLLGQGTTSSPTEYEYVDKQIESKTTYFYRLGDVDFNGVVTYHSVRTVKVGKAPLSSKIEKFTVLPAYPNPFNPSTTLTYRLDTDSKVTINIYDITGQLVNTLVRTEQKQGWHSVEWNGTDRNNKQVPAGIYLSKIISNNNTKTTKLMLLK